MEIVNFLSLDNSKEAARIALKFYIDIFICFLKNPIDFGEDLPKIVIFRLFCHFCLIWKNMSLFEFLEAQCKIKKILNQHNIIHEKKLNLDAITDTCFQFHTYNL